MAERALGEISDEEEIWLTIRSVLTVTRVAVLLGTIIVSEFFEQYYILDLNRCNLVTHRRHSPVLLHFSPHSLGEQSVHPGQHAGTSLNYSSSDSRTNVITFQPCRRFEWSTGLHRHLGAQPIRRAFHARRQPHRPWLEFRSHCEWYSIGEQRRWLLGLNQY